MRIYLDFVLMIAIMLFLSCLAAIPFVRDSLILRPGAYQGNYSIMTQSDSDGFSAYINVTGILDCNPGMDRFHDQYILDPAPYEIEANH